MIALLDNTVLSNFATIGHPELLHAAFAGRLAAPRQAFDELVSGVRVGKLPSLDWSWLQLWTLEEAETADYNRFLSKLNAGEAACLAMALNRGCRFLTDDRDAREFAHRLRIPLSGTLGVLVRLVDLGALSLEEADDLLQEMIHAGYRSPFVSLRDLV